MTPLLLVCAVVTTLLCSSIIQGLPLDDFISKPDVYNFTILSQVNTTGGQVIILEVITQTWNGDTSNGATTPSVWHHYMTLCLPQSQGSTTAILYIDGDDVTTPPPTDINPVLVPFCGLGILSASIQQVPIQPLIFANDQTHKARVEDEILAYSWKAYLQTGDSNSLIWFAMAKAGVRAMDTVQTVASSNGLSVQNFVVAGSSKRGWAAWLTAAGDPKKRVTAVVAIVAPVFRMKDYLNAQYQDLGNFTYALSWYEDQGVLAVLNDPASKTDSFFNLVDGSAYLDRLNIPKLFVDATGDEFFMLDIMSFFFNSLPGESHLRMVPNTDHNFVGLPPPYSDIGAFIAMLIYGIPRPQLTWTISYFQNGTGVIQIVAQAPGMEITEVRVWRANTTVSNKRDFRMFSCRPTYASNQLPQDDPCFQNITWTYQVTYADSSDSSLYVVDLPKPEVGFSGHFVEFVFSSAVGQFRYVTINTNKRQQHSFMFGICGFCQLTRVSSFTTEVAITPNTYLWPPCACNGTETTSTTTTTTTSTAASTIPINFLTVTLIALFIMFCHNYNSQCL